MSHLGSEEAVEEMMKPLSALANEVSLLTLVTTICHHLSLQITSPLFYLFITDLYQYGVHCLPPKPGLLAWLQYALDIHLHHQVGIVTSYT